MTAIPSAETNESWFSTTQKKSRRLFVGLFAVGIIVVVAAIAWTLGHQDPAETPHTHTGTKARVEAKMPARVVNLPHMQLQAQYSGPLLHTIIQGWRDPIDGAVCYIYLPIAVHHSQPTAMGYVEYESGGIGTISCLPILMIKSAAKPVGMAAQQ
jgi:hypothetical protein